MFIYLYIYIYIFIYIYIYIYIYIFYNYVFIFMIYVRFNTVYYYIINSFNLDNLFCHIIIVINVIINPFTFKIRHIINRLKNNQ